MFTIKNYKLFLLLLVAYLVPHHFYYAKMLDYLVSKKMAIGVGGVDLRSYIQRGQLFGLVMNIMTVSLIFVRIVFVTLCLLLGTFLSNSVKLSFRQLLKAVLLSEFVFLVRDIVVISFMLASKNPDRPVVDASLSAGSLFGGLVKEYPAFALPASSISLYLLGYIFLLSFLLFRQRITWWSSLRFVCSYFGVSYIIWICLTVSFNLYASN
jgi:hypothetical protein